MEYTVEELSPVKKKIAVSIPADEVDASFDKAARQYRHSAALPGFRKGKTPLAMIARRFAAEIRNEAGNELISSTISGILREMAVEPLTGIEFDGEKALNRGAMFSFSFSFELMPVFDLPPYEGIEAEQEKAVVADEEIDRVISRLRDGFAERIDVEEKRLPKDGDMVNVAFAGFDASGAPVESVAGDNFWVSLGEEQVIPDFDRLLRTVLPGESGEGLVKFPDTYGHRSLAGTTVTMKVTVNKLQEKKLPAVDEDFAKKAGGFDSVDAMRDSIRASYMRNRENAVTAKAKNLFLESLLDKVDFPLPEGLVSRYAGNILADMAERSQRGNALLSEEEQEKQRGVAEEEAKKYVKIQIFLLTVAKKEEISISSQEMEVALRQIAARGNHDIKAVREHYARNNMMPALRDRLLADKALDALYAKAAVKEVDREAKIEDAR